MSFDFIDKKFGQLKPQKTVARTWGCDDCCKHIDGADVTFQERHDERSGGCGCIVDPWCPDCDNGGWVQVHSPRPPMFGECPTCLNPHDRPSP